MTQIRFWETPTAFEGGSEHINQNYDYRDKYCYSQDHTHMYVYIIYTTRYVLYKTELRVFSGTPKNGTIPISLGILMGVVWE